MFELQYNYSPYIDDSIYYSKVRMATFANGNFNIQEVKTEECNKDSFYDETRSLFDDYSLNGIRCISKNQTSDIMLNGFWGQDNFKYITISLYPCTNSTLSDVICKPQEVIDKYLHTATFGIYTLNNNVLTKDFENPFSPVIYNDFYAVSKNTFTHAILFLMHSNIYSDIGWLFQEINLKKGFCIDKPKVNLYLNAQEDTKFVQFQLSDKIQVINRKYMKLQELCAQIGGIAKFLMILGKMLNFIYDDVSLREYIYNLFIDNEEKKISKIPLKVPQSKDSSFYKVNQMNISNKLEEDPKSNNMINNFISNQQTKKPNNSVIEIPNFLYKPIRSNMRLSFIDKQIFCCLKKQNSSLIKMNKGFNEINKHFSIEKILKNSIDLQKMKYFLFSNYELDLFNTIGNSVIELDNKNNIKFNDFDFFIMNYDNQNKHIRYDYDSIEILKSAYSDNFLLSKLIKTYNKRPFANQTVIKQELILNKKLCQ